MLSTHTHNLIFEQVWVILEKFWLLYTFQECCWCEIMMGKMLVGPGEDFQGERGIYWVGRKKVLQSFDICITIQFEKVL